MICKNCGADNADNVQYCSGCGANMQNNPAPSYQAGNSNPTYVNVQVPSDTNNLVSVGAYVGMWFAMCVPILNIIMMIIWGTSGNKSKKNFVLAYLVLMAISVGITILSFLFILLLGGTAAFAVASELETMIFTML